MKVYVLQTGDYENAEEADLATYVFTDYKVAHEHLAKYFCGDYPEDVTEEQSDYWYYGDSDGYAKIYEVNLNEAPGYYED